MYVCMFLFAFFDIHTYFNHPDKCNRKKTEDNIHRFVFTCEIYCIESARQTACKMFSPFRVQFDYSSLK